MPVIDCPFPAFESIPKEEMRAAYFWELDREFLDAGQDPRRPWPRLRDRDRQELLPRIGHPIFTDDLPPDAAWLYPPFLLLNDSPDWEEPKVMGLSEVEWGLFFADLQYREKGEKVLTDDFESSWKHLRDEHGQFRLVFAIDPNRSLKDVMADIERVLKTLHRFPAAKPPPRGDDWPSRLCDLLTLRLERSGHDLEQARGILLPFQQKFGLAELKTKKHWSTRRGRAKCAMAKRQAELERLREKACENDRDGPNYWKNEPLWNWGSQGFGGSCSLGHRKPHGLFIVGMEAAFIQKPWTHFLSLHGITKDTDEVDWADLWYDFEDWRKANRGIYGKLSREGRQEHQDYLRVSDTKCKSDANGALSPPEEDKSASKSDTNGEQSAKAGAKAANSEEGADTL